MPPNYNALGRIGQRPLESMIAAVILRYQPFGFGVLATYVVILPFMTALLYLRRRNAALAWAISFAVYLAPEVFPKLNLPGFAVGEPWFFNPLGWQFLFFIGICLGDPQRKTHLAIPRWILIPLSLVMLAFGFFVLKASILIIGSINIYEQIKPVYHFYETWGDKTNLQPLRVLHFLALAYLTSLVLPANLRFWSSRWARPVVVAGQHSLEVYAWGLVLAFVAVAFIIHGYDSTSRS